MMIVILPYIPYIVQPTLPPQPEKKKSAENEHGDEL